MKTENLFDLFDLHKSNDGQYAADFIKIIEFRQLFNERTNILWYPSGGRDFRPVNFLSILNVDNFRKDGTILDRPKLFVYSCIGPDIEILVKDYESHPKGFKLFEDKGSVIECIDYIPLNINRNKINYLIDKSYIDTDNVTDPLTNPIFPEKYDSFFMRGQIKHLTENIIEEFYLLYVFAENINFFHEFILNQNILNVLWLCPYCEGTALGFCKKSVVTHIYVDNAYSCFKDRGFKPKYNIPYDNFTKDEFKRAAEKGYVKINKINFTNPKIYHEVYEIHYR